MLNKIFFGVSTILMVSANCYAGQWNCVAGLGGKEAVTIAMQGTATGEFASEATVNVGGVGGGALSLYQDKADAGELARAIIGAEDPRSKLRLRVMNEQVAPAQYKIFVLLVNLVIKQELDGTCTFTP
ncbi:MAG: hypothetical protein AABZ31_08705 [Bdellovibrionota bacterium]